MHDPAGHQVTEDPLHLRRLSRGAHRQFLSWRLLDNPLASRATLAAWEGPATSLPPIFVGGTGRSGTTIIANLLGQHPDYLTIPIEVRFMSGLGGGLVGVLEGDVSFRHFKRQMGTVYWDRPPEGKGLHRYHELPYLRATLRELEQGLRSDPDLAARRFIHRLLDPIAINAGKRGWIEMTPNAAHVAGQLARILPDAMFVHAVRDGRDVASSLLHRRWGPSEPISALDWWHKHLDLCFTGMARVPSGRASTMRMEALFALNREPMYRQLLEAVGLEDAPPIRTFFENVTLPDRIHAGQWRTKIPPEQQPAFEAHYRERVAQLLGHGWPYDPDLVPGPATPAADATAASAELGGTTAAASPATP